MVKQVVIFVEGGARGQPRLNSSAREGLIEFFVKLGLPRRLLKFEIAGNRSEAYKDFCRALENQPQQSLFLLVDSESSVQHASPWQHVQSRQEDQWACPEGATDDQLHLMVQCMEAWFLADPDVLARYFGQGFNVSQLPSATSIEQIEKSQVLSDLRTASSRCKTKKPYDKGKHAFAILAKIDPAKVTAASPYALRLVRSLHAALAPN